MGIPRFATAHWEGDLKSGKGRLSTPESGLMDDTAYGFDTRFGDRKGVHPEELIAAAHAGCSTLAMSLKLSEAGHPPAAIDPRAEAIGIASSRDRACRLGNTSGCAGSLKKIKINNQYEK